jgi:hypothetical protein
MNQGRPRDTRPAPFSGGELPPIESDSGLQAAPHPSRPKGQGATRQTAAHRDLERFEQHRRTLGAKRRATERLVIEQRRHHPGWAPVVAVTAAGVEPARDLLQMLRSPTYSLCLGPRHSQQPVTG